MMNDKKRSASELYGRPIFASDPDLTLTDQILETLREEIHNGHWQIGERLPSVAALSKQTGLGRTPIQQAFERLQEAGYVRLEQRSGTYLASRFPNGRQEVATIGVALHLASDEGVPSTDAYAHYRLARLLRFLSEQGYATEVRYLRTDAEWENVDTVGKIFSDAVQGVFALHPYSREDVPIIRPGKLPFVYLGSNSRNCQPVVAGDTSKGFYEATHRLILLGHRSIACFMDTSEPAEENAIRMEAHEAAMTSAGLPVMRQAFADSGGIRSGDFSALRQWLEKHSKATGIICMRGPEGAPLVEMARLSGLRVPEDLSLIGHGEHVGDPGLPITRIDYDYMPILNAGLELLSDQMRTRRVAISRILVRPHIVEGATLAKAPHSVRRPAKV